MSKYLAAVSRDKTDTRVDGLGSAGEHDRGGHEGVLISRTTSGESERERLRTVTCFVNGQRL